MNFSFYKQGYGDHFFEYVTNALEWANGLKYKDPSKVLEVREMLQASLEARTELESLNLAWNAAHLIAHHLRPSKASKRHYQAVAKYGHRIHRYVVDAQMDPSLQPEHLKVLTGPARDLYLKYV
jgi:hypothetical protein